MKKVVVFGGSGFVGSHVVDALIAEGYSTRVFDIKKSEFVNEKADFIEGDILDAEAVSRAVDGMDIVYNFAGLADIDKSRNLPLKAAELNIIGNINILEACRKHKVERFVYASTVYVFSEAGSFYRCTKLASEQYVVEYQKQFDLNFTILRYGTLYGTRANEKNSVFRYLKEALIDEKITYYGAPDFVREYIHVEDAAKLSVEILGKEFENEFVILTGTHPMSIRNLFEMIKEILGREIEVQYLKVDDSLHYKITPYSFNPKLGRKLVSHTYYDMGQGLLKCLNELQETVEK